MFALSVLGAIVLKTAKRQMETAMAVQQVCFKPPEQILDQRMRHLHSAL
jgi:hypothetical protein